MGRGEMCEQGEQRGSEGCVGLAALQTNADWKPFLWFAFPSVPLGCFT